MPTPSDADIELLSRWYARLDPARTLDLSGEASDENRKGEQDG